MSSEDTKDVLRAFDGHASRRSILKGAAAFGAGGTAFLQLAEALAQASAEDVARLTILSQPGIVPEILKDVTVPMFNKSHPKTSVVFEAASNAVAYPKMLAQRSNPVVSGGMVNDLFAQRGINDKMWAKFDPELVPNAANLPADLKTPGGFGIPFHLTPWGIMYNPDKVEKPTSWTDLWNPKYKGRVSMWDVYYDAYIMAGVVTGKGPDVQAGIKAWEPHKANIGAWVNSPTLEEDLVSRGEMWLAPHWGSWTAMAKSQGKNVAFTIPKEGGVQWAGHMQLCAGFSPAVSKLTQIYMNTWLSDECQLAWIERGLYSPASTKVQIPEALKSNPAIISAEEALKTLVRPDFVKLAAEMPKLKSLIDRTLKS
ncbi:ABC transporter substrate-binding protein [Enterovirga rhinocerotis]|uniref:Spermidine/putrescine-binding protein n=1 Tax=Enterovirga rhinocerotis TaxID=1339210 RepID=A0A4R7BJM2_9HYPH|nr:extracellular solute-binding protein [Enterovirga rhinocerotis]TDR85381.1 spermidine/putrescine-binding protein [Enterovirga rhinocerotis]